MATSCPIVEISCPECGSRNSINLWRRVYSNHSDRVAGILDGSLFEFTCLGCGRPIHGDYSIDFIDRDRHLIVRYEAAGDPGRGIGWTAALFPDDTPDAYRLIRAPNQHAFIELAHIWRERLDEARMLLMKHVLAGRIAGESGRPPLVCSFDRQDEVGNLEFVIIEDESSEPETVRIPSTVYEEYGPLLEPALDNIYAPGQWLDWSERTAELLLRYVHTA